MRAAFEWAKPDVFADFVSPAGKRRRATKARLPSTLQPAAQPPPWPDEVDDRVSFEV